MAPRAKVEKRVDPEDGNAYTYDEIAGHYKGKYKRAAIDAYWNDTCYAAGKAAGKAKAKAKAEVKSKAKAKVKVKAKAKFVAKKVPDAIKIHYFPLKARGLPALLALEVGKVNYEAKVIQFADWGELKASGKYPFGYLGAIELADGTIINETNAMLFTVGKIANLNGGSIKDFGTSSMLACKAAEVFTEFTKVQPTIMTVKDWNKDKAKALEDYKPTMDGHLDNFEKLCSDDGKFTKTGKTTGELHLFSLMYHMKASKYCSSFRPKLDKFYASVEALEGVKKCLEGKSKMGDINDYVTAVP